MGLRGFLWILNMGSQNVTGFGLYGSNISETTDSFHTYINFSHTLLKWFVHQLLSNLFAYELVNFANRSTHKLSHTNNKLWTWKFYEKAFY